MTMGHGSRNVGLFEETNKIYLFPMRNNREILRTRFNVSFKNKNFITGGSFFA